MKVRLGVLFGLALVLAYVGGEWRGRRAGRTTEPVGDFWIGTSDDGRGSLFTTDLSGDVVTGTGDAASTYEVVSPARLVSVCGAKQSGNEPPCGPHENSAWLCVHSAAYLSANVDACAKSMIIWTGKPQP